MPIIGFNYTRILVERKKPLRANIKVKNDININNIEKTKVPIPNQEGVLQVDFTYSSEYQPGIASIEIKGNLLFLDSPKEAEKAIDSWKKSKKLPTNAAQIILNAILIRCGVKALSLSQDLNLPPHIRLPTINPKTQTKTIDKEDYVA